MRVETGAARAQLDGLPLINCTVTVIRQEVRSLKAAFKDFALTSPTTGEIEALHADVNRVQAENAGLGREGGDTRAAGPRAPRCAALSFRDYIDENPQRITACEVQRA